MLFLLLIVFISPLLFEGVGFNNIHYIILYVYLLFPSLLFVISQKLNKKLFFPSRATAVFSLFLLSSAISTFAFSLDKQRSVELILFYISSFLVFIFFYNFKKEGRFLIKISLLLGSVVFITSYLLFQFKIELLPLMTRPYHGYQLVAANFGPHNHLGDYIGLVIIFLSFHAITKKRKILTVITILFLPIFLFSFSRSSYNALFLTGLYYFAAVKRPKIGKWMRLIFVFCGILVFFFSIISVKESQSIPFLKPINNYFAKRYDIQYKDLFGNRLEYFSQAIKSISERPVFGVGPGNFHFASEKNYSDPRLWTETAHNIFLDVSVENGLFAFIGFATFVFFILKSGLKSNLVYPLLFIYLLINFQTDYTYRIYSLFILFMILAGVFYKEDKEIACDFMYGISSLILHLILVLVFANTLFLHIY